MSHILVRCQCGAKLQLGIKVAGKVCRCPKCEIKFAAPEAKMFGLNCGRVLSVRRLIDGDSSHPHTERPSPFVPQRQTATNSAERSSARGRVQPHAFVRESLMRLFQETFRVDPVALSALALAAHPWPDDEISRAVADAIAAELLPSRNLCHHNIREVAIDRLLRIAETLEHELAHPLAVQYLNAAEQLQDASTSWSHQTESSSQIEAARGAGDLLLSPLGYGVPVAESRPVEPANGADSGGLTDAISHLAGLAAASASADIGLIFGDEPTGVSIRDLARAVDISLPLDRFDRYLGVLNSRDRDILVSRSFVLGPPDTLEDVAARWKVTRERIRQLEVPLKRQVLAEFSASFRRLGQPFLSNYRSCLVPTDVLHSAARRSASGSRWSDTAAAVMLQIIGPWKMANGWTVHPSIAERVDCLKDSLEKVADRHGLLPAETVQNEFHGLFRDESDQQGYAKDVLGLGRTCGQWTIRDTNKCRIAAALKFLGQPATKDELAALTCLPAANIGSTLGILEGVVRADKERWGFEEWIEDAYDGIFGEIVQRIDAYGGSAPVNLILRELPVRFGVSEASVRAYLSSDAFKIDNDFVRRAEDEDYKAGPPDSISGAIQVGAAWGQRLSLFERHFIGYSLGVSFDIAYANGVRPDDDLVVPVKGMNDEVSVIWRRHSLNRLVDVGRASDVLRAAGFRDGDDVIVIPGRESVEFLSVAELERRVTDDIPEAVAGATLPEPEESDAAGKDVHDPLLELLGD